MAHNKYMMSERVKAYFQRELDERSELNEETNCLVWTGAFYPDGYGRYNVKRSGNQPWFIQKYLDKIDARHAITPHRLAWLVSGEWFTNGRAIMRHKCGNKACINVLHLEVGNHTDNYHDGIANGERKPKGYVKNQTPDHIKDYIRAELVEGRSVYSLSNELNMYMNTIICYRDAMIKQGKL